MKKYFNIYITLLRLNYHRALSQRADFFAGLFGSISWAIFSVVAIYILSARASSVYGWNRQELFILIGVFNILVGGIFRTLFARNFNNFPQLMRYGELDSFLLKPIDTQFAISTQRVSLHGGPRIFISILFTFFVLFQAHLSITFSSILAFSILAVFGLIAMYAFWFLVLTLTVWLPDVYNLEEILYSTDSLTRYPPQILPAMKILLFYVFFPFTLVVSTPTKALLNKLNTIDVIVLIGVAFGLLFLSRKFWKFALRYYTSASG